MARVWIALWALYGCAEGYGTEPGDFLPRGGSGANAGAFGGTSGAGASGMGGASGTGAPYTGEACRMGDTAPCTCQDTGTQGTKFCRFDRNSPTQGTFSECGGCAMSGSAGRDPGDVEPGPAGSGGSGGRAGTSGSGGRSGSGGSGTGGSGSGSCSPGSCSQPCFPIGVLACCRSNGTCGCTWAPGAYCL